MVTKDAVWPLISEPESHILIQLFNIGLTEFIPMWDGQICSARSTLMRHMTYAKDFPVHLAAVDLG